MMWILLGLLIVNSVLHFAVVARYGVRENLPVLVFGFVYAALAVIVYLDVPWALWAVLIPSIIGIIGLSLNFSKITHDKTLERIIWVVDAVTILYVGYLLFLA